MAGSILEENELKFKDIILGNSCLMKEEGLVNYWVIGSDPVKVLWEYNGFNLIWSTVQRMPSPWTLHVGIVEVRCGKVAYLLFSMN